MDTKEDPASCRCSSRECQKHCQIFCETCNAHFCLFHFNILHKPEVPMFKDHKFRFVYPRTGRESGPKKLFHIDKDTAPEISRDYEDLSREKKTVLDVVVYSKKKIEELREHTQLAQECLQEQRERMINNLSAAKKKVLDASWIIKRKDSLKKVRGHVGSNDKKSVDSFIESIDDLKVFGDEDLLEFALRRVNSIPQNIVKYSYRDITDAYVECIMLNSISKYLEHDRRIEVVKPLLARPDDLQARRMVKVLVNTKKLATVTIIVSEDPRLPIHGSVLETVCMTGEISPDQITVLNEYAETVTFDSIKDSSVVVVFTYSQKLRDPVTLGNVLWKYREAGGSILFFAGNALVGSQRQVEGKIADEFLTVFKDCKEIAWPMNQKDPNGGSKGGGFFGVGSLIPKPLLVPVSDDLVTRFYVMNTEFHPVLSNVTMLDFGIYAWHLGIDREVAESNGWSVAYEWPDGSPLVLEMISADKKGNLAVANCLPLLSRHGSERIDGRVSDRIFVSEWSQKEMGIFITNLIKRVSRSKFFQIQDFYG